MRSATSPSLAVKNIASPKGWSQKWAHELSTTANHSEISTSKALRGLPWAQGAAGSNPAAPTTFRVRGNTGVTPLSISILSLLPRVTPDFVVHPEKRSAMCSQLPVRNRIAQHADNEVGPNIPQPASTRRIARLSLTAAGEYSTVHNSTQSIETGRRAFTRKNSPYSVERGGLLAEDDASRD